MEATFKESSIDAFLTSITGKDRASCVHLGKCMTCDAHDLLDRLAPADFKDDVSRAEYLISGMCQACQDYAFGSPGGTN